VGPAVGHPAAPLRAGAEREGGAGVAAGVLRRDDMRCAYCGVHASTIDHVIPRSRGGADSWENLVACCLRCNNIKGDRTPQEMGWSLRFAPRPPHGTAWLVRGTERAQPEWREFLAPAA